MLINFLPISGHIPRPRPLLHRYLDRLFWKEADHWIFRYHSTQGELFFSLSSNVCHSKIFVEYPSFGNAGIQKTLLAWLKFSGCYSLVKFSCFVLPWKRHDPKLGRRWYRWESSHNHVFGALDELIFADNYTQLCTTRIWPVPSALK